ncbi:MAG TPA: DUF4386 domain-containing protein [Herpetosiphonaceae bacterium]
MNSHMQPALQDRVRPGPYRTTARVVGGVYLTGFVVGIGGEMLIQSTLGAPDPLATVSANRTLLAVGAILWLIAIAGDAAHGILMLPVLKPHSERLAFGYFGTRLIEAGLVAVMVLFVLVQIPLSTAYLHAGASDTSQVHVLSTALMQAHRYAYHVGMIALGFAGLLLCSLFFQATLVPRLLAVWGLIGYATFLGGSVLAVLGLDLGLIHTIPGGLWEVFMGVWLIAKGFRAAAGPYEPTTSSMPLPTASPDAGSVAT